LQNSDIELVAVEYRKENAQQILRVFIDNEAGVDLDMCTRATRIIKPLLDENNIYYDHLELSSPGLDRVLKKEKDFKRFRGYHVKIKMLKQYQGPNKISGVLLDVDDRLIIIKAGEEICKIPRDLVSTVRLNPEY
jgi:ribosome maturation factor RimP